MKLPPWKLPPVANPDDDRWQEAEKVADTQWLRDALWFTIEEYRRTRIELREAATQERIDALLEAERALRGALNAFVLSP